MAKTNFPYDVFLSHSSKDKSVGRALAERPRTGHGSDASHPKRRDVAKQEPCKEPLSVATTRQI